MRLALYQPDIPQNLGAALRLSACLGVALDVIEPCGFPLTDAAMKRAALDYGDKASVSRHASFAAFRQSTGSGTGSRRLVLFTTKSSASIYDFAFQPGDILLFGKESAGVTAEVAQAADARVRIPMRPEVRSMNLAASAAIALAEALRQTGGLP